MLEGTFGAIFASTYMDELQFGAILRRRVFQGIFSVAKIPLKLLGGCTDVARIKEIMILVSAHFGGYYFRFVCVT